MDPADRFPPLHYAVLYKDEEVGLEIVKILLNKGADPTYKDGNSQTIAFYLARDGMSQHMQVEIGLLNCCCQIIP